jgi:ribosome-binding protein aMBF1 (putative translation factor)
MQRAVGCALLKASVLQSGVGGRYPSLQVAAGQGKCDNGTVADEHAWIQVGARIAASRRARGLSQEELAAKVGLERTVITKIEVGRRHINSLELVRLAEVLDRPLQSFV